MLRCPRLAYPDKPVQRRLAYHVYLISERIKNSRILVIIKKYVIHICAYIQKIKGPNFGPFTLHI